MISFAMVEIAQNTLRYVTLAQVLLVAAMNQVEAKRKPRS
jgi:hypothetical protein